MSSPNVLQHLVDIGIIDAVVRPLMSGKEAQVFLVLSKGEHRVAKLYKDAQNRSFRQRAVYAEGRRVKNSRRQRAIDKRSKFGKAEEELAWKSAEVDAIHRAAAAGVRVPTPYDFVDGVLVMELIADERGEPAPRLVDVELTADEARDLLQQVVREVCRMLCAGLVHGDLSDFNILLSPTGPVIIDFPQAVDAAANNNAQKLLIRDLDNVQTYLSRWAPELRKRRYGREMWALYDSGKLQPDSPLTGRFKQKRGAVDASSVLAEIRDAEREEQERRERLGLPPLTEKRSKYAEKKAKKRAEMKAAAVMPTPIGQGDEPSKRKRKRKRKKKHSPGAPAAIPARSAQTKTKTKAPSPPKHEAPARSTLPDDLDALLSIGD